MHLSKRLQMVADCVTTGNVVADVGCDHAYISIYLVEQGIVPKTIALDINEGPLERATQNVINYGFEDRITTRLSDGLSRLEQGIADSVVIAGMGGALMVRILSEGKACVATAKELILQPQSEIEKVREYLHKIGFAIVKENMCIDEGKFYTVIKAQRHDVNATLDQRVYLKYGRLLLEEKHPILKLFLEKELKVAYLIKENLVMNGSETSKERLNELEEEIKLLQEGLAFYKD